MGSTEEMRIFSIHIQQKKVGFGITMPTGAEVTAAWDMTEEDQDTVQDLIDHFEQRIKVMIDAGPSWQPNGSKDFKKD